MWIKKQKRTRQQAIVSCPVSIKVLRLNFWTVIAAPVAVTKLTTPTSYVARLALN